MLYAEAKLLINLDNYIRFKADLDSPASNISYLLIIGWSEESDRTLVGAPSDDAIFISQKKENFDGDYYSDHDMRVPSINERQD